MPTTDEVVACFDIRKRVVYQGFESVRASVEARGDAGAHLAALVYLERLKTSKAEIEERIALFPQITQPIGKRPRSMSSPIPLMQ